ncbi:MAG: polysaccharide biosynthesis tyrosine autokinase [Kouleothrix sp.]|nr:polysaccharide biosynthesis tyrosine autokinase [Kouleothrix sp.]
MTLSSHYTPNFCVKRGLSKYSGVGLGTMELKQYVRLLWRWSWLVVVLMLLPGAAAYAISKQIQPVYQASTSLLVNQAPANSMTIDYNALRASEGLAKNYVPLLVKRPVLAAVISNLKLNTAPELLAAKVDASVPRDTQIIVLTVDDPDPQLAATLADEIVKVFIQRNRDLQAGRYTASKQSLEHELERIQRDIDQAQAKLLSFTTPLSAAQQAEQSQTQTLLAEYNSSYATLYRSYEEVRLAETQTTDSLYVVEPAYTGPDPVSPRTKLNVLMAVVVGALLALGLIYVIGYLDNSVKTSEDVEKVTGIVPLAAIARIGGSDIHDKLASATNLRSSAAEDYRSLRVNIEFSTVDTPISTIVVTSGSPGEGKSLTATNLAVAFAQSGKRVILVDTDLRRPVLHHAFNISNMRGVTTALVHFQPGTIGDHIEATGISNLRLMPSGPLPPNPADLLGSRRMTQLIEVLKQEADVVVFDSPPVLAVVDAALLGRLCDATLLVVRAGSTRTDALRRMRDQIVQSGPRMLGVVLNQVAQSRLAYSAYYNNDSARTRLAARLRRLRLPFGWGRGRRNPVSSPTPMIVVDAETIGQMALYRSAEQSHADLSAAVPAAAEAAVAMSEQAAYDGHSNGHLDVSEQVVYEGHNNGHRESTISGGISDDQWLE